MKAFLTFFAIFFLVFSIVGFINGRQDVNEPDYLEAYIFSKVSNKSIDGTQYLYYAKDADTMLVFNVDTDSLQILNKAILMHPTKKNLANRNLLNYLNSTAVTATASGALGWSVKDFVPKTGGAENVKSKSNIKAILGAVIGAVSGYYVGYWLATKWCVPDEDSDEFTPILTSRTKWIAAKERITQQLFDGCMNTIGKIPDMKTRVQLTARLKRYLKLLVFVGDKPQITSANFADLVDIYEKALKATS